MAPSLPGSREPKGSVVPVSAPDRAADPPPPPGTRDRSVAIAGVIFATMLFGGHFVAGRHGALVGLSPADLVTLRFAVSGVIFAPLLLGAGIRNLGGVGWGRGAVLAILAGGPYAFLVMLGLSLSSASHGSVLNPGTTPLFGMLLSFLMLGERPPRGAFVGIPVVIAGLILVAGPGLWAVGEQPWIGDTILALSGASYALFTVLLRRWRIPALQATAAICVLSALIWLPGYAIFIGPASLLAAPAEESIGQAVFQGAIAGGLAVFLYARAVTVIGPSRTVMFPALVPAFGTLLSAAFLGEHLSLLQIAGIAAVCGGLLVAVRRPRGPG